MAQDPKIIKKCSRMTRTYQMCIFYSNVCTIHAKVILFLLSRLM